MTGAAMHRGSLSGSVYSRGRSALRVAIFRPLEEDGDGPLAELGHPDCFPAELSLAIEGGDGG